MNPSVKIIVARYNEDLSWMKEHPFNLFRYIVYNKGVNENFEKCNVDEVINLPNIGRCDHTYLYHIVYNFNNLNDINVFFPGCLNMLYKKKKAKLILNEIIRHKTAIFLGTYSNNIKTTFADFTLDNWTSADIANKTLNPESKTKPALLRPYSKWYDYMFGNIKVQYYCIHGIFSVHKLDIITHDITHFQQILNTVSTHSNPEAGHYIERSWAAIFHPFLFTKVIKHHITRQLTMQLTMQLTR
jgi:hypothetical protein